VTACEDSHSLLESFFDVIVEEALASTELLQAQEQMKVTWRKV
jgi:hypothetical protein